MCDTKFNSNHVDRFVAVCDPCRHHHAFSTYAGCNTSSHVLLRRGKLKMHQPVINQVAVATSGSPAPCRRPAVSLTKLESNLTQQTQTHEDWRCDTSHVETLVMMMKTIKEDWCWGSHLRCHTCAHNTTRIESPGHTDYHSVALACCKAYTHSKMPADQGECYPPVRSDA